MIEAPEKNLELTPEQVEKEAIFRQRLQNLENEISIATKNLKVIKADVEKATKEKTYQEEILSNISSNVEEKTSLFNKINQELIDKNELLYQINSKISSTSAEQEAKVMSLKDREDKVTSWELLLSKKEKKVAESNQLLESHINTHNEKVTKLKAVIALF